MIAIHLNVILAHHHHKSKAECRHLSQVHDLMVYLVTHIGAFGNTHIQNLSEVEL